MNHKSSFNQKWQNFIRKTWKFIRILILAEFRSKFCANLYQIGKLQFAILILKLVQQYLNIFVVLTQAVEF